MSAKRLMRAVVALLLASAVFLTWPAEVRADVVILADGRKIEGTVRREGDYYVIRGRSGTTTRVSIYEVAEIRKVASVFDRFSERHKALEEKKDATAEEWFELAGFASENKLTQQAREAYLKALDIDPAHEGANRAVGHVRYQGTWMTEEKAKALQGLVKVGGRWVPREEAEGVREADRAAREERDKAGTPAERARAAADAFAPRLVECPKCNGTKAEIWGECRQCARSGRPGWLNLGERFAPCMKCRGTGKIPLLRCRHCKGMGKVNPNVKRTPSGKTIPVGYHLCEHCDGTGGIEWDKCRKCARSKYPGFSFFGEYCVLCPRCRGAGRICLLKCYHCRGSGMLSDK